MKEIDNEKYVNAGLKITLIFKSIELSLKQKVNTDLKLNVKDTDIRKYYNNAVPFTNASYNKGNI